MAGRLAGKVAIITGGGHGIGKAYALGLAREGAKVVVAEIDAIAAETVAADLKRQGFEAIAVRTDLKGRGLGYLLLEYNNNMNTPMAFAIVLVLSVMGLSLYGVVEGLERLAIPWHVSRRGADTQLTGNP